MRFTRHLATKAATVVWLFGWTALAQFPQQPPPPQQQQDGDAPDPDSANRGGQPSTTQPIAGPWLSPQVVTRNKWPKLLWLTTRRR